MQKPCLARFAAAVLAASLAACSMVGTNDDGGGTQLGSLSAPANPSPGPAAVPARVAMGSFLEGPVGSKLTDTDRDAAFKAETQAMSGGERRTWRGAKGVYGYVVPGSPNSGSPVAAVDPEGAGAPSECRSFTHTVYFGGRPQTGHGTGCRDADGTWRVVS